MIRALLMRSGEHHLADWLLLASWSLALWSIASLVVFGGLWVAEKDERARVKRAKELDEISKSIDELQNKALEYRCL
jgi:hypothetical protein